jgi:hypothetical protein
MGLVCGTSASDLPLQSTLSTWALTIRMLQASCERRTLHDGYIMHSPFCLAWFRLWRVSLIWIALLETRPRKNTPIPVRLRLRQIPADHFRNPSPCPVWLLDRILRWWGCYKMKHVIDGKSKNSRAADID